MKFFDFHSDRSRRDDGGIVAFPDSSGKKRDASGNRPSSRVKRDAVWTGADASATEGDLATC